MIGRGSLRVYKVAPTSQPYTLTSTGESSCKAHESAHPDRNAGPHFLNLTGYFINVKLLIYLDCSQSSAARTVPGERVHSTFDNEFLTRHLG